MLIEQIDADLKQALKEKNEIVLSSLRNLKAALGNAEIEKKQPLTDDEALTVLAKKVKQHKDSIESFTKGDREDLAKHEIDQMAVLQKYLPAQMSESEVEAIVKKVIADLNATSADFGKVMKLVVAKVKGRADGSLISKFVKEQLK
jgi:uncharacterized protein YqeY